MRKILTGFAIALVFAIGSAAYAQTPNVSVYFDEGLTQTAADCPTAPISSVIDTVYVVGNNFNMWISAVEFAVDYSTKLTWLGDAPTTALVIGNTPAGISLAWNPPLNGFGPALFVSATVVWMCDACAGIENTPVVVIPNPNQGFLRAIRWPDNVPIDAVGMTSLICSIVPTDESTWGKIKALYN